MNQKYTKLKVCKYSFEVSKVAILSIATGLSFISIFAILSMILIPIVDSVKHTSNVDYRINIHQNDEYDFDKLIKGDLQTCCIFDDQLTDNKKISDWFIRSRKKNCSKYFLAHSYFKMGKTLRLNVNYIILFKIPKNQLTHIYNDQPINIDRELFYKIISELNMKILL